MQMIQLMLNIVTDDRDISVFQSMHRIFNEATQTGVQDVITTVTRTELKCPQCFKFYPKYVLVWRGLKCICEFYCKYILHYQEVRHT